MGDRLTWSTSTLMMDGLPLAAARLMAGTISSAALTTSPCPSHMTPSVIFLTRSKVTRPGILPCPWPKNWPVKNGWSCPGPGIRRHGGPTWERVVLAEEAASWGIPGLSMGISGTAWVGRPLCWWGPRSSMYQQLAADLGFPESKMMLKMFAFIADEDEAKFMLAATGATTGPTSRSSPRPVVSRRGSKPIYARPAGLARTVVSSMPSPCREQMT